MAKEKSNLVGRIFDDKGKLMWKVNTPGLLKEITKNNQTAVLKIPLTIFGNLLAEVGERASEINDPKLNALMCRLAIYAESDPYDKENFNQKLVDKTIYEGYTTKNPPANELLALEYGFKQSEKGNNLDAAFINYKKDYEGKKS